MRRVLISVGGLIVRRIGTAAGSVIGTLGISGHDQEILLAGVAILGGLLVDALTSSEHANKVRGEGYALGLEQKVGKNGK